MFQGWFHQHFCQILYLDFIFSNLYMISLFYLIFLHELSINNLRVKLCEDFLSADYTSPVKLD